MTTTNHKGELIHQPKLKRSKSEQEALKRAKKDFNSNMRRIYPGYVKSRGCLGLRSNDLSQVKTLLDMALVIQAEQLDQATAN